MSGLLEGRVLPLPQEPNGKAQMRYSELGRAFGFKVLEWDGVDDNDPLLVSIKPMAEETRWRRGAKLPGVRDWMFTLEDWEGKP